LYFITAAMNLTTNLKLIELMDSKHALLQRLLREAPGTYQHSLQVANLSEIAAEAIGANAQLVRVAAMYHDIGKILNPYYFTENTTGSINPHDDLNDPLQSAKVIIGHVIEGERLARRHKLPARIRDFILEHHGTTQVLHFYHQAVEKAGDESKVNIEEFTYPGPAPRARETAILMLADGCESATRSVGPSSKTEIEGIVNHIFELRLSEGQLNDSGLTLNDLKTVRNIFIQTLQAMYHPRIAYKIRKTTANGETPQLASGIVKHLESNSDPKKPKLPITQQMDKQAVSMEELEDLVDENLVQTNIPKEDESSHES
ncbi:MAG: HDIG domain-containing protein, partial [Anaerolineae bacterium]|nr:HDIG domain-containing protein [Anaerolineae bacterium]